MCKRTAVTLNEAAHTDVDLLRRWEEHLPEDDKAVLAAFAELDHAPDLDA